MKTDYDIIKNSNIAIKTCLADIPFIKLTNSQIQSSEPDFTPDIKIQLDTPDGATVLLAEVSDNGQPRIVRNAIDRIRRWTRKYPRAYGIFIAPYISPASAKILSENDIGYVDLAGNCRISFWPVFISKEGKPNLFAEKRDLRTLYSPKAARIIRVLLSNPHRKWRIKELADEAEVSLGQAANVKKLLQDREWLRSDRDGLRLVEPELLLAEWSETYSIKQNTIHEYYSLKSPSEAEADLADVCQRESIGYTLTGFSGAARLAPFVRYQRAMAYISGEINNLAELLDLKEVDSGANVWLVTPYDDGILYGSTDIDAVHIASPVQIYLDLSDIPGRGEEAAEHILKEVIRKQWR